jgi:hypothetical protein
MGNGLRGLKATLVAAALLLAVGSASARGARPAAVRLDPAYGKGGVATTALGVAGEEADAQLSLGPKGTALVANGVEGTAARFDADGSWDTRFGEGGRLKVAAATAFGGRLKNFSPTSITIDREGRPVAFGSLTLLDQSVTNQAGIVEFATVAAVVRFVPGGRRLDPSFAEGKGYVEGSFGVPLDPTSGLTKATALAGLVDSADRPVFLAGAEDLFAGCQGHGEGGVLPEDLVRLTDSGELDTGFGAGTGVSRVGEAGNTRHAFLGLAEGDQPVIGLGRPGDSFEAKCGIGTTVQRFGSAGESLTDFGPGGVREFSTAQVGLVEPSGAILLVEASGRRTLTLTALGSDGSPESGFGQGGAATVRLPAVVNLHVEPVGFDAKGRLILAGFVGSPTHEREKGQPKRSSFVVGRLLPDGRPDPSFGKHGWLFSNLPAPLELNSAQAILDSKGRLVIGGILSTRKKHDGAFSTARFLLDG